MSERTTVSINDLLESWVNEERSSVEIELARWAYQGSKVWQGRYEQAARDLDAARSEADRWRENRDQAVAILERELAEARAIAQELRSLVGDENARRALAGARRRPIGESGSRSTPKPSKEPS